MRWGAAMATKRSRLATAYADGALERAGTRLAAALAFLALAGLALTRAHAAPVQEVTLELASYRFVPASIEVLAGRTVRLTLVNRAWIPHNFSLHHPDAGLHVDVSLAGRTATTVEFMPRRPGIYGFHCDEQFLFLKSHRDRGMVGRLVVHAR